MQLNLKKCKCAITNYRERCAEYCEILPDYSYNKYVTDYAKKIMEKVHMNKGDVQDLFVSMAKKFSLNCRHAAFMYDCFKKGYFIPSTPVIRCTNGHDTFPISCFVTTLCEERGETLMRKLITMYKQSLGGGGMGVNLSNVREFKCVNTQNLNNGLICYIRAIEGLFDLLKTDKSRPAIFVYYVEIDHPDVREFMNLRKPTFDSEKIKLSSGAHIGVIISDAFMEAVRERKIWYFRSRYSKEPVDQIEAIVLWRELLIARTETGEPMIFYYDNAQRAKAEAYKLLNIDIPCTNMCTEIMLPSGPDNEGKDRATICCLGSVNLERYDIWKNIPDFIPYVMLFLDCVMQYYIDNAADDVDLKNSVRCAIKSRPVALGVMSLAYLFQKKNVVFGSSESFIINQEIFSYIKNSTDNASVLIGNALGHAPDNIAANLKGRFVTTTGLAPTSYISLILNCSPTCSPVYSNCYAQKTAVGTVFVKNKYLSRIIKDRFDTQELQDAVWEKILHHEGSIQKLQYFTQKEKEIFRTAHEIDQRLHVKLCGSRQKYLTQTQSVNLYFYYGIPKKEIHEIHLLAHQLGLPTLYYAFCSPRMRVDNKNIVKDSYNDNVNNIVKSDYVTCESCAS